MAVFLGLIVAVTYGSGDFFGGLASRRSPTPAVVAWAFGISAVWIAVVIAAWSLIGHAPTPAPRDLWLGVASGFVGPVGVGLLYRGLGIGRMSVVAPITAVLAAAVPLAWGLATGDRPSPLALVGVAVALVAVVLISMSPSHEDLLDRDLAPNRTVVPLALASGLCFGVVFVLLGSTTDHAGLWPLLVSRPLAVMLVVLSTFVVRRRQAQVAAPGVEPEPPWHGLPPALRPGKGAWPAVAGAGVLDITANGVYLAATHRGLLSIVAVLSSLYPASTVAAARVFLGERLHRIQVVGLALAAIGVAAMALA